MDFSKISHMHILWLQYMLDEIRNPNRLKPAEIARYDVCELGYWIDGLDVQYRDLPEYVELANLHRHLHQSASDAVALAQAGKINESQRLLSPDGSCIEVSKQMLESAGRLLQKMDGHADG